MNRRAFALALAAAVPCSVASLDARTAYAQQAAPPPAAAATDAARAEARDRFDRGLRLFNAGDNAGALAEFKRAYDLIDNVVVLYNIGLVYAQMGRAVEAADALDRVLQTPQGLSPERLAIARRTRDEQATRIAEISVEVSGEGAAVEVDGIEAAKSPLAAPLRVTSGTHTVAAVAPGFVPQRKEVTIASGEKQSLRFELVPMQGRLAHLAIKTHVPGADAFVDDQRVGSTPLAVSVPLAPGAHRVELRRPGYVSARSEVTLCDGATGEVVLEPEEDAAALGATGGLLAVDASEPDAVLTIDGRRRGLYREPVRLPAGPHHMLLERGNFEPFERDVAVDAGRTVTVRAAFEPTPDFRSRYVGRAQTTRTLGWVSLVAGAVVAASGAVLVVYDAQQRNDGNATINRLQSQSGMNQVCDSHMEYSLYQQECLNPVATATSQVDDANTRDYFGWGMVGVGAAGAALGVVLLVTGDDPHKYDAPPPAQTVGRLSPVPAFWATRGGGGLSLSGAF
jgi:PEGA domain